jgi:ergothioneine biosynthesis protein EgtB
MADSSVLIDAFQAVRQQTLNLTTPLSAEDMQLQSMPDASPGKWHLAHTSWFFEAFVLARFESGFTWHNELYAQLFNSYYNAMGDQFPRPKRGMISQPGLGDIFKYREVITESMTRLLRSCSDVDFQEIGPMLVVGINHEQQHQELILTDIKHALFQNPAFPAVYEKPLPQQDQPDWQWVSTKGGEVGIGFEGEGFCFDNELPRHKVLLDDFDIANRPVSNADWLEFMKDGGYEQPLLWLSDGWAWRNKTPAKAPLYWVMRDDGWQQFNLSGLGPLSLTAPVIHINYYEADAYARWSGCRLPTEQEWEHAGVSPCACWEWTASPYCPYPGFKVAKGNVGEYNGKFMINQMVLRGASGATAEGHSRASYRNFFYPDARWQFSGVRLIRSD